MKIGVLEVLIILAIAIQVGVWLDKRQSFRGWEDVQLQSQTTSNNLDSLGIAVLKSVMIIDAKEDTNSLYISELTKMHHMQESRILELERRLGIKYTERVLETQTR